MSYTSFFGFLETGLNSPLVVGLVVFFAFAISLYITVRRGKVQVTNEGLVRSSVLGSTTINYRDISTVSFRCAQEYDTIADFNIYIEITGINKNSIELFIEDFSKESLVKLFSNIVNNVDSLKNNQDYKNIAEGKYTQDDFYRLAGVLDAVNLTRFDLNDTRDSPTLKALHYISIAGAILFVLLFVYGIVIVMQ